MQRCSTSQDEIVSSTVACSGGDLNGYLKSYLNRQHVVDENAERPPELATASKKTIRTLLENKYLLRTMV
jgi:hypothetical protein